MRLFSNVAAGVVRFFGNAAAGVRHVNQRYARPEIQTTPFVTFCLWSLRIYLLLMVGLMLYALVAQARAGSGSDNKPDSPPAATEPAESQPGAAQPGATETPRHE
jgi:hypothetical protein